EEIVFDDGTVWHADDWRQVAVNARQTAGDDYIEGYFRDDVITGGQGDDTLVGHDGSDTYIYVRGDGNDTIAGEGSHTGLADRLVLHGIAPDAVTFAAIGT